MSNVKITRVSIAKHTIPRRNMHVVAYLDFTARGFSVKNAQLLAGDDEVPVEVWMPAYPEKSPNSVGICDIDLRNEILASACKAFEGLK